MKDLTFNQAFKKFKFLAVKYNVRLCVKETRNRWARPASSDDENHEKKVFVYLEPDHKSNDYVSAPSWRTLLIVVEELIREETKDRIPF